MIGRKLPSPALAVGATYQNWRLEREIGRGGTGIVYLARHQFTARRAAIKVIRPSLGGKADDGSIARFHIETELHVTLRHPNLPEFFDADLLPDGTAVLVLEHLDGRDLGDTMRCLGKMAVGDALFIVSEVLRPLMVMHAKSVHRDIKPPNIYVCRRPRFDSEGRLEKGRVRLLDFGIAKLKGKKGPTREHNVVGTMNYMSPEQINDGPLDGRSDLYALGVVLYEMLAGRPIYVARDNEPDLRWLYDKHLGEKPADLRLERRDLPDDVWKLCARLLEKRPEDRYATTEEALLEAKASRAKHLDTSKIFRDDVDDVIERMDALRVEGWSWPAIPVSNPFPTQEEGADAGLTEESPAPSADRRPSTPPERVGPPSERPGAPRRRATFRLPPVGRTVEPWQQRIVDGVRSLVMAPRCFRRPALLRLGAGGAVVEVLEMRPPSFPLVADLAVVARADKRLELSAFDPSDDPDKQARIDGHIAPPRAALSHGAVLSVGGVRYRVTDLAVFDPRAPAAVARPRRLTPPKLTWMHLKSGLVHAQIDVTAPLTLAGSLVACDLVVPDAPDVLVAVWIRGDGDLEMVELDTSVMPYGDAIRRVQIVEERSMVRLGADHTIVVIDSAGASRPSASIDERPGFGSSDSHVAPVSARTPLRTSTATLRMQPVPPAPPRRASSSSFPAQRPAMTTPENGIPRTSTWHSAFDAQGGSPTPRSLAARSGSTHEATRLPSAREAERTTIATTDGLQVMAAESEGLRRPLLHTYELQEKPLLVLGSDPDCDISIAHSKVSPKHCEIARAPDGHYSFRDLGTPNGTFLNGTRVRFGFLSEKDAFDVAGAVTFRLVRGITPGEAGGSLGRFFRKLGIGK